MDVGYCQWQYVCASFIMSPSNFLQVCMPAEQAPRVDRPPQNLGFATTYSLPATQGQRSVGLRTLNLH
jgi:hypothetical protein